MEKNVEYWNELATKVKTNEEAFAEVYEYFFPRIYKLIMSKTMDTEMTDEIVSKTFLKMYSNLNVYDPKKAAFSTWLYTIAENELKMFLRTKSRLAKRETAMPEDFDTVAPALDEPEQQTLTTEREEQIRAALNKLPERDRQIIIMSYWLEYPPRKIAEILDLTPNHVSVILKRAKSNLKEILS